MEATPFEQAGELAPATKWTGEPTVAPLPGLETVTPAKTGNANTTDKHTTAYHVPTHIPTSPAQMSFLNDCEQDSKVGTDCMVPDTYLQHRTSTQHLRTTCHGQH